MSAPVYAIGLDDRQYRLALQAWPLDALEDEIQAAHVLWLSLKGSRGDSERVAQHELGILRDEHRRRERVYKRARAVPMDLGAARRKRDDLPDRIAAMKEHWSIETFCERLLAVELRRAGRDSYFGNCPLPGHAEKTGSFHLTPSKGLGYCHGCHRGGDVIKLTQLVFGLTRVIDALERLERESGIVAA